MVDKFSRTVSPYSWISPQQSRNWVENFRANALREQLEMSNVGGLVNNPS